MSAWGGGVGSWADDTERELEEKKTESFPLPAAEPEEAFPTLGQAVTKGGKKKKEKVTIPLAEFASGGYGASRGRSAFDSSKGLSVDEMMALPTGPRARDESEDGGRGLGGGFKDYGGYRGGRRDGERGRDREGGFNRDREGGGGGGGGAGYEGAREDNRDYDRWGRKDGPPAEKREESSQPAVERPRLNLQKRTIPIEGGSPAPAAAAGAAGAQGEPAKPKAKFDPFGGARPREAVLAEKGVVVGDKAEENGVKETGRYVETAHGCME